MATDSNAFTTAHRAGKYLAIAGLIWIAISVLTGLLVAFQEDKTAGCGTYDCPFFVKFPSFYQGLLAIVFGTLFGFFSYAVGAYIAARSLGAGSESPATDLAVAPVEDPAALVQRQKIMKYIGLAFLLYVVVMVVLQTINP